MRVQFVTINSTSNIPVMRYIISYVSEKNDVELVECFINGNYKFKKIKTKYLNVFNDVKTFNNQNIFFKIQKYILTIYNIIIFNNNKQKSTIYVIDYELLIVTILLKKLLILRNVKIIYHQFEVVNFKSFFSKLLKFIKLDILIFPEINRANFFLKNNSWNSNTFILPNTCSVNDNIKLINKIDFQEEIGNRKVIGHIGNLGCDHFINVLINIIEISDESRYYFLLVGNYDFTVLNILEQIKNKKNIKILNSLPHSQLPDIYNIIDFGLILYKPLDYNYDFCAPNKLYEYWSYGIPVFAHKLNGLTKLFEKEEYGLLFDFYDNNVHLKILKQFDNKLDKKNLKSIFSKNFDINLYLPIYDKLFENNN